MDTISFEKNITKDDTGYDHICAVTAINGNPLADIAAPLERAAALKAEDKYNGFTYIYQYADDLYAELIAGCWLGANEAVVMRCSCGDEGCSPLVVSIEYNETTVTWRKFYNWHRPEWDYDSVFPVFRFDKAQYNAALMNLKAIAREVVTKTQDIRNVKMFSKNNKPDLLTDTACGCYSCLRTFPPYEIKDWQADLFGTALCPYCGNATVIGKSSGYPISTEVSGYIATRDFLKRVREYFTK